MSHDWREDEPIGEYVDKDGKDVKLRAKLEALITTEIIAELERLHNKFEGLGFSSELPKDFTDGLQEAQKAFLTEIEDRIKELKAKDTA